MIDSIIIITFNTLVNAKNFKLTFVLYPNLSDVTDAINAAVNQHVNDGVVNAGGINVIDDDLHISDDSDDEQPQDEQPQEQPMLPPQQPRNPPPPTPRRDADDGIWF